MGRPEPVSVKGEQPTEAGPSRLARSVAIAGGHPDGPSFYHSAPERGTGSRIARSCRAVHVFFAADFRASDALRLDRSGVLADGPTAAMPWCWNAGREGQRLRHGPITLPVAAMRGYVVQFSAMVKAENVSRKPQP